MVYGAVVDEVKDTTVVCGAVVDEKVKDAAVVYGAVVYQVKDATVVDGVVVDEKVMDAMVDVMPQ